MLKPGFMLAAATAVGLVTTAASAETLRWATNRDIVSLDPYAYDDIFTKSILNNVYEGLVRYNRDLKIEPALATSWEVHSDTVWRFKLRQGVSFHNGNAFTADDVIASLTRVSDPASPLRGSLSAYKSATKVDDYTVDIELTGPYPLLLNSLTGIYMFDKEWLVENNAEKPTDVGGNVEGYATFNVNGTGPFILESRQPDAKTVFVANPKWWDNPEHNLDRIEITPITSAATRVAALLSGEVDFVDDAPIQDLARLEAAPNVKILERTDIRTVMLGMNRRETLVEGGKNPLNELKVRQAMEMALDRDLLRDKVMRGKSRTTGTPVAPEIPGYSADLDVPVAYNPDKAKALLAEAGFGDGFEFVFVCANDRYSNEEQICQAIASMWARIGLKPKLDIGPRAVMTSKFTTGKADVYDIPWSNEPMLDSYSILSQKFHTKTENYGVFNWGGWSYPELDALVEKAGVELDLDKRLVLQTEALKMVKYEVIVLPLHQLPMAWAVSSDVKDMPQSADNKPRLWYVTK